MNLHKKNILDYDSHLVESGWKYASVSAVFVVLPFVGVAAKIIDYNNTFDGRTYFGRFFILLLISLLILLCPVVGLVISYIGLLRSNSVRRLNIILLLMHLMLAVILSFLFMQRI